MGAQDHTEKVLRDIHVLFSKAEPYQGSKKNVVVDKNEMMELLKELNVCMYDMMDEYELSDRKKEKANREMQKQGDDIIFDASRKAEDIYAASIMYTDNALHEIQEIMEEATHAIEGIYTDTKSRIEEERRLVKRNQSELKSQLNDLIDTQKYLRLIEDENHRLRLEKERKEAVGRTEEGEDSPYASVRPEIKINKDYFLQNGIPLDDPEDAGDKDESGSNQADGLSEEEMEALSRDLDREYFDWKDKEDAEPEKEKKGFSLFGKVHAGLGRQKEQEE